ncbi:hypothetical protein MX000_01015 [Streptococcus uberis]|nr:hypothetical protein [Streptococcus uberis]
MDKTKVNLNEIRVFEKSKLLIKFRMNSVKNKTFPKKIIKKENSIDNSHFFNYTDNN